jgi:iron complex transport system ATP-binding protein
VRGETPALAAYGVSWSYGAAQVLREISFELSRGQILAVIGPNGSGKSTLLKRVAGLLGAREGGSGGAGNGQVRANGEDLLAMPSRIRARRVAYVAADLSADFPLTALEAVHLGRFCQAESWSLLRDSLPGDDERVRHAMEACLCWELRERLLETLSGGERQRVALARALAQGSSVLCLDETLSRMDLDHQIAIGRMLQERAKQGLSLLLVSHDLNLASEWADSCLLLHQGRKVAEGPVGVTLVLENLKKLYPGVPLLVAPNPATGTPKVFFGGAQK